MKIEVANGEIVDKLTILKIKLKNSDSNLKTEQILKEMELKNKGSQEFQLSIFDAHTETFESIRKELDEMDINNLTPVEALMKLQAIKKKLN